MKKLARARDEQNKLLDKAVTWRILEKKFFPEEGSTLHAFTTEFRACLERRLELMKKHDETRFDENVMGKVIADHLHYNLGHSSDEIRSLAFERGKEDGPGLYELCSLLVMFMVRVSNEGVDYPID